MIRIEFTSHRTGDSVTAYPSEHYVDDHALLEAAFTAFNGFGVPDANLDAAAAAYPGPSMSEGDTVIVVRSLMAGEPDLAIPYRCAASGWERLSCPTYTIEQARRIA